MNLSAMLIKESFFWETFRPPWRASNVLVVGSQLAINCRRLVSVMATERARKASLLKMGGLRLPSPMVLLMILTSGGA